MSQTHKLGTVATNVRTENGTTYVRYHATDVVAFNADTVTLKTEGWKTVTTKLRMNQASNMFGLGFQVYQDKFDWYVKLPSGETVPYSETYLDGMTFARK